MFKNTNRNLFIIALIALVNMLGYGIIIPILYAYSKKFGLNDFQNGLLFAMFSICQFISTPIIGRLSDKYGRRPMLLISIIGTAASFFMMAFAPNFLFLFLARALDGLTAGNIPVAFAVISDSTKPEDRPKAFGLIGAAFNFGFVFGPAISALTVGFGSSIPFIIAGIITMIAVILTYLYLPETNKHMGEIHEGKLFDFGKMWHTLFDPNVGVTFVISLIFFLAFACAIIYGFQPFTLNVLKLNTSQNAMLFTLFGITGLIAQTFLVQFFSKNLGIKKSFSISIFFTAISFIIMAISHSIWSFVVASVILSIFNSVAQTLIPTILSRETDEKSQGSIQGLNSSYQSIGMIIGPLLGGAVATISIPSTFVVGAVLIFVCFLLSFQVMRPGVKKESAF
ncbi:MAG TPA: MFS transporter [Alphaproteobacteria bacterium]|jgi:MFS family permease|nr:MFS transporter [Alphaproteobacteria bacterium]